MKTLKPKIATLDTRIGWHVGRKKIVSFLARIGLCTSWRSVQRRRRAGTIIIRRTPEGQPFIIEEEVIQQKLLQSDALK